MDWDDNQDDNVGDGESSFLHIEDAESPFLQNQEKCRCPKLIQETAEAQGITCQRLFRTVYVRAGYPESVSRAIFALFAGEQKRNQDAPIPLAVKEYCKRTTAINFSASRGQREKCFGCSLTDSGLKGVLGSYERIHPEITQETLVAHAKAMPSSVYPSETLSPEDELLRQILDSGALEEGNEGWQTMMQWDE